MSQHFDPFDLDMVREVTVSGAAGKVSRCGRRVAVATGSTASGAGPFGAIIVTAGSAARRFLHRGGICWSFRTAVGVARIVAALLNFRGVRIVRGGTAAMRARSIRAQV